MKMYSPSAGACSVSIGSTFTSTASSFPPADPRLSPRRTASAQLSFFDWPAAPSWSVPPPPPLWLFASRPFFFPHPLSRTPLDRDDPTEPKVSSATTAVGSTWRALLSTSITAMPFRPRPRATRPARCTHELRVFGAFHCTTTSMSGILQPYFLIFEASNETKVTDRRTIPAASVQTRTRRTPARNSIMTLLRYVLDMAALYGRTSPKCLNLSVIRLLR